MPTITPFLWYENNDAEEAANFYLSVFPDAKIRKTAHWGPGAPFPLGSVLSVEVTLNNQELVLFNGGPGHGFTDVFSLVLACDSQEEIDTFWSRLTADGGSEVACGWLKDKFGVCWQVTPRNIGQLISNAGSIKALMGMKKMDIAALQAAATP